MQSIVSGTHGGPILLAQLPAVMEPKQKREQRLWKSPVAERVLEKMRRQFPALKANALVQVFHHHLLISEIVLN